MNNYDARSNDERYRLTDTSKREHAEAMRAEVTQHVNDFLARGGVIRQIPFGVNTEWDMQFKIKTECQKFAQTKSK